MKSLSICPICQKKSMKEYYIGNIRSGKFGNKIKGKIFRCKKCNIEKLEEDLCMKDEDYLNENYRVSLEQKTETYNEKHDNHLKSLFQIITDYPLRRKIVADVGCAGGGFLDYLSNVAEKTIAIEPCKEFHKQLLNNGHSVFGDLNSDEIKGIVDYAFAFQVIEHVQDPIEFLVGIKNILKKDGILILSTPNLDDFMIKTSKDYREFFYRVVHRWYFNRISLNNCIEKAGFKLLSIKYFQKFPLSNSLLWLRDKTPNEFKSLDGISHIADTFWRGYLEETGQSDTIFLIIKK